MGSGAVRGAASRRGLELALGVLLVAAMLGTVVVVYKTFRGNFSDDVVVSARITGGGDALRVGDIVTYRDVIVGEVTAATGELDGSAVLRLKLKRDAADVIPANVSAVALPATLFGTTKVQLVPAADTGGPRLREGTQLAPEPNPRAVSLQAALSDAYALLSAVKPAQLDAALSALADVLRGQGANIGTLITRANHYLTGLVPQLPAIQDLIRSFATVTARLAQTAPDLLASVGDLLTVGRGIQASKQALSALLDVAPRAVQAAQGVLNPTNVEHAVTVLHNEVPVLESLAAHPQALTDTIDGFRSFAGTFSKALVDGPYAKVNIILTGANIAALFNVAVGQKGEVFRTVSDPPLYTAADCPRYPGASGPNCPTASTPSAGSRWLLTSAGDVAGTASSVGDPGDLAAIRNAAAAITGRPADQIPDAAALLLGPLLRGSATLIAPSGGGDG